ncbi:hypothetical protein RRG08_059816 [Elysia crispata]|uniref:Uncharacterized protein n=1 Tax=Elysia crispata TaxID=231223 RepID=A0AAE1EG24_9GAST|nr:hypothetical protein RRG08_059816 [Elysia crispata]
MESKSQAGQMGGTEPKLTNLRAKKMLNAKGCDGCATTQLSQTDPVLFLPTVPSRRTKPIWMTDIPSFELPGQGELPPDRPVPLDQWSNPAGIRSSYSLPSDRRRVARRQDPIKSLEVLKLQKKRKEEFRKALINLIMQGKAEAPVGPIEAMEADVPTANMDPNLSSNEVDMFRYFYYIHNGVDVNEVTPLTPDVVHRILNLMPESLKKGHCAMIEKLVDEICDDFILNTKKSILDFVLRRGEVAKMPLTPVMQELNVIPQPWHGSVIANKRRILKSLRMVNPCITEATNIWFDEFARRDVLVKARRCFFSKHRDDASPSTEMLLLQAWRCRFSKFGEVAFPGAEMLLLRARRCCFSRRGDVASPSTEMLLLQARKCCFSGQSRRSCFSRRGNVSSPARRGEVASPSTERLLLQARRCCFSKYGEVASPARRGEVVFPVAEMLLLQARRACFSRRGNVASPGAERLLLQVRRGCFSSQARRSCFSRRGNVAAQGAERLLLQARRCCFSGQAWRSCFFRRGNVASPARRGEVAIPGAEMLLLQARRGCFSRRGEAAPPGAEILLPQARKCCFSNPYVRNFYRRN